MDYIQSVRKQLVELKDMLELNKEAIRERCSVLQGASSSLMALSTAQDSSLRALYELPLILQTVLANDSVGALILGSGGKVLLFNGAAQKIFGDRLLLDEMQHFSCDLYFNSNSQRCPKAELPWEQALRGQEARGLKLYLPRVTGNGGAWLSIDAVPLFGSSRDQIGGAVILVVDITEPLQVDLRVKSIVTTLSQHIMTIECAQTELKKLAEKLGVEEPAEGVLGAGGIAASEISPNIQELLASLSSEQSALEAAVEATPAVTTSVVDSRVVQSDTGDFPPVAAVDGNKLVEALTAINEGIKTKNAASEVAKITAPQSAPAQPPAPPVSKAPAPPAVPKSAPTATPTQNKLPPERSINLSELIPAGSVQHKPILIVDDLAVNQKLLQLDLETLGFDTEVAANGQEAAEKILAKDYLVVFMDCDMPIMNGYESTAVVRDAEKSQGKHTPIVAMTAYDRHGDQERCYAIGMDHYLTKGVGTAEIEAVVNLCIKGELNGTKRFGILRAKPPAPVPALNLADDADVPVINIQVLVETYGKSEADDIINMFFSTGSSILDLLAAAIDEHNSPAVNHLAYSLKGPCASLCLQQVVRVTVDIASYAALGRWSEAQEAFLILKKLYGKLETQVGFRKPEDKNATLEFPELPPPSNEFDVHQQQVLEKLEAVKTKMGKNGAIKLIEAYDHDLNGIEEKFKTALINKDAEAIRSMSHFLTGCYKSLSAKQAAQCCRDMGDYAAQGDWNKAAEQYVPMFKAIRSISYALDLFRKRIESE